jgi:hypothetical protein
MRVRRGCLGWLLSQEPAAALVEATLQRLEGVTPQPELPRRDGRRFVWCIGNWSQVWPSSRARSIHIVLSVLS